MHDRESKEKQEQLPTNEAVGTLIWLLDSSSVDRRRYPILNRLRKVRDSDEFDSLPEALREKVRQIIADAER